MSNKINYAVACIRHLLEHKGMHTSADLSKLLGISRGYLTSICDDLQQAGLVTAKRGYEGGYQLLRNRVTYQDVAEAVSHEATVIHGCEQASAVYHSLLHNTNIGGTEACPQVSLTLNKPLSQDISSTG
jgi:Rrf2 family protein